VNRLTDISAFLRSMATEIGAFGNQNQTILEAYYHAKLPIFSVFSVGDRARQKYGKENDFKLRFNNYGLTSSSMLRIDHSGFVARSHSSPTTLVLLDLLHPCIVICMQLILVMLHCHSIRSLCHITLMPLDMSGHTSTQHPEPSIIRGFDRWPYPFPSKLFASP